MHTQKQSPCHSQPSVANLWQLAHCAQRNSRSLPLQCQRKLWVVFHAGAYQQYCQGMLEHHQTPSKTCSGLAAVSTCQLLFSELSSRGRTLNHSSPADCIKREGRMTSGKLKSDEAITLPLPPHATPLPSSGHHY